MATLSIGADLWVRVRFQDSKNHETAPDVLYLCTGHILADAGEREVNLLETWDIKPFA